MYELINSTMNNLSNLVLFLATSLIIIMTSCAEHTKGEQSTSKHDKQEFIATLQKHLDAVSNKDIATLKSTLSPEGKMQLILPRSEISNSVDSFLDYHTEWFQDTSWTFETKILNTEIGNTLGLAIVETMYREPERNGQPYFNRMTISYVLKKTNNNWYIIKDHASSIEKSTDKK